MHSTITFGLIAAVLMLAAGGDAGSSFEKDTIKTSNGELGITFIGHGTLMLEWNGKVIHVDPYGKLADYQTLPKADLILLTHHHRDHLDPDALAKIRTEKTAIVLTEICGKTVPGGTVLKNGDQKTVLGIPIRTVPAYNLKHKRENGQPFHPKGEGNGYVLSFGDTTVYIAGDTENIPEMAELKNITITFLPMNLPYTMTAQMAADAAKSFRPKILYPYHRGETDVSELVKRLKDEPDIEVRVRKMK